MRLGQQTNVPGLYRDGKAWVLRATARTKTGVKTEKRKRLEDATQGEALLALEELRRELKEEVEHGKASREQQAAETISAYAQRWLQSLAVKRRGKIKPASIETRVRFLERFVLPFLGHLTAAEVTPSRIEEWKEWLAQQEQPERIGRAKNPRAGEAYAHETLLTAWATMRALLSWTSIKAGVPNPAADLRFDVAGRPRQPKSALTGEEFSRLIKAAERESPDIRTMLILGFITGMRFCELSALEWRDLDLARGLLRIERSQVLGQVGPPKTEATRRDVYLPAEVVSVLREHRAWLATDATERAQKEGAVPGLVFPSRTGGYRAPAVLKKPLRRCCQIAGIGKHLTSHCMRMTSSNLIRQAAGDAAARAMVGHAKDSAEMTFRYSDVAREERLAAQRAAFGDLLGSDLSAGALAGETGHTD